ncbi:uncharacterized protein BDV17DRAFT_142451 [Aspergillus undulatus]|uniref:uncharacterized protein n=1 Tax=Aspergillus undulatus TaxID=1810928 RepID=UPI003CCCDBF6
MPPSRTPLRAPPRQNARSQFASTPRFLFSQLQSQRTVSQHKEAENRSDSILASDEDVADPFSKPVPSPAPTPARGSASHSRRKEMIEDSGSELGFEQDLSPDQRSGPGNEDKNNEISSSLPPDMAEYAELEDLFRPVRPHRAKRRRVSVSFSVNHQVMATATATPEAQKQKRTPHDFIETSSTEPYQSTDPNPTSPSLPYRTTPQKQKLATPRPSIPGQSPATPATGPSKSSIRGYPRFLPPSSSAHNPPKPTFVLPRSPSPDQADDPTIHTPFSPSSHALRHRGRQRSSTPSYLPGGMASEVRSWILDMGTKRGQQMQAAATLGSGRQIEQNGMSRYSFVLRIRDVRQSALGSCGPLAFLQGQVLEIGSGALPSSWALPVCARVNCGPHLVFLV